MYLHKTFHFLFVFQGSKLSSVTVGYYVKCFTDLTSWRAFLKEKSNDSYGWLFPTNLIITIDDIVQGNVFKKIYNQLGIGAGMQLKIFLASIDGSNLYS